MSKLYVPVGIPGCGKSTLSDGLKHVNLRVVSTDSIRQQIAKDINDQTHNDEVFDRYHATIEEYLLADLDVYADATNLRDYAREKLRSIVDRVGADIHLIVFTNLGEAVDRNQKRERQVPADVMVRMLTHYEQALRDIPQETYTSVTYIEGTA